MANFNDRRSSTGESTILSSIWDGLSPHLIARFYPLKKMADGSGWGQSRDKQHVISAADNYVVDDGVEVWCPITDGTSEITLGWHSPFEGMGAESKIPALSAQLQSGVLSSTVQSMLGGVGLLNQDGTSKIGSVDFLKQANGRTSASKLNSTQVFSGMPPVKMSMTCHFRALKDPIREVRDPIQQLKGWALPQYLADEGLIAGALNHGGSRSPVETIFPSMAPSVLGMKYGDATYSPVVIESISEPFTNPRSEKGVMLSCSVTLTLATLTALDRRDVQKMYR